MRNLRAIREAKGLRQCDLAARTGLGEPAISLIENGKRNPRRTTVLMLAVALNVTPAALYADDAEPDPEGGARAA